MILAIDPGSARSAYVALDPRGPKIAQAAIEPNELVVARLPHLWRLHRCPLVIEHSPAHLTAGRFFPQQVLETAKWVGRFEQAWNGEGGTFYELPRLAVLEHLCANRRARDPHVRAALIARFGAPGTKRHPGATYGIKADLWQALGVAVTWWERKE